MTEHTHSCEERERETEREVGGRKRKEGEEIVDQGKRGRESEDTDRKARERWRNGQHERRE